LPANQIKKVQLAKLRESMTHHELYPWAFREQLGMLGVEVVRQRVVIDRNRVTGAGVTSGIDFGFTLLSLLCGEEMAKMAQLMMEYTPEPPFNAGTPETAGEEVVKTLMQFGQPLLDAFLAQTQASAARLKLENQA
jgi:cyclohexyl-isocyanide hydratase